MKIDIILSSESRDIADLSCFPICYGAEALGPCICHGTQELSLVVNVLFGWQSVVH